MSESLPAERVGRYLILERIGAGGMGEVFRARDTRLGRTVALKMLPPEIADDPLKRERFEQDARKAATLSHPAIAAVHDIGEADGRPFIAIEYVPGQKLPLLVAGRQMSVRRAVSIAIQVADALAHAHAAGIVHREIKPEAIMVTPKDAAKVLDFGLAHWTTGGIMRERASAGMDRSALVVPGTMAGTVAYMSPEQALNQRPDGRSDVFSFGAVLYEMLTGRSPFAADTSGATLMNVLQLQPPPPSALNPQVPPEVDAAVMKALARDVDARHTATTFAAELRTAFGERTEHILEGGDEEPIAMPRSEHRPRRWGRAVAGLAIVAVLAAAAYGFRDDARRLWQQRFGAAPAPVLAVLPLEGPGESDPYFASGLTADLITRLGQVPGMQVVGREAARRTRERDPASVARAVGASAALTGTVRRTSGALQVDLRLIDVRDGSPVWESSYRRPPSEVFAMVGDIARDLARELRVSSTSTAALERTRVRRTVPEGYDTYLEARAALLDGNLPRAAELFASALKTDDQLSEAYAGLAEVRYRLALQDRGYLDASTADAVAKLAEQALAMDPDLPDALIARALTSRTVRDAVAAVRAALEIDPTHTGALRQAAALVRTFAPELGATLEKRAARIDPSGPSVLALPAESVRGLVAGGRFLDAAKAIDDFLRQHPEHCEGRAWLAAVRLDDPLAKSAAAATTRQIEEEAGRSPGGYRCAALAAAARADAGASAAWLRRIASDEAALLQWSLTSADSVAGAPSWSDAYPWIKVSNAPEFRAAYDQLVTVLRELGQVVGEELGGS